MHNFVNELINELPRNQIFIQGSIDCYSDKFQRFKEAGKARGGRDIFVKILGHCEGAVFGDWHDKDNFKTWWLKDFKTLTRDEKKCRINIANKMRKDEERWQAKAIFLTTKLFCHKKVKDEDGSHPYVKIKKIIPHYAKRLGQHLLLPIKSINGELISYQSIVQNPYGKFFKKFKKGIKIKDHMVWLCEPLHPNYDGQIRICEGYATGCTIFDVLKVPVFCALNAYNLVGVSELVKKEWPRAEIIICADNDLKGGENIGVKYAVEAKNKCGGFVTYPIFDKSLDRTVLSDFNDLFCLRGHNETLIQLSIVHK